MEQNPPQFENGRDAAVTTSVSAPQSGLPNPVAATSPPSISIVGNPSSDVAASGPLNLAPKQNNNTFPPNNHAVPNPLLPIPNPLLPVRTVPNPMESRMQPAPSLPSMAPPNPMGSRTQPSPVPMVAAASPVAPQQPSQVAAPTISRPPNPMQQIPQPIVHRHGQTTVQSMQRNPVMQRPLAPLQPAPPQPITQQVVARPNPPQPISQQVVARPNHPQPISQQTVARPNHPQHVAQHQAVRNVAQTGVPPSVGAQSNHGANQTAKQKSRIFLSAQAKQALAKAIWSAIRSPTGEIAPELMNAALTTGLPKHAILNAARVAREREAQKRRQTQRQQQQQQQQQQFQIQQQQRQQYQTQQQPQYQQQHQQPQRPPVSSMAPPYARAVGGPAVMHTNAQSTMSSSPQVIRPVSTVLPKPHVPQMQSSFPLPATTVPPKPVPRPAPKPRLKSLKEIQQAQAARLEKIKIDERAKWKRLQHGIFLTQKGRYMALPHSVSGVARSSSTHCRLPVKLKHGRKRFEEREIADLVRLQQQTRANKKAAGSTLLDPEKFKRSKIEPKKFAKALDRVVRKARQNTADTLNKQHKELSKMIMSHQSEFFKFHRAKRADASRLARTIRDNFDKESKKKEKDSVAAEKARLAALKANDMDAYSKLLEETKNDRLKFLMDKTEKHFSQISTSLLQERNKDGSVSSTGGTASYYASAHLKTEEVRQPSILVGGDLKEYQMSGLQWLVSLYNNKLNGILADEMGLGKTIQAIALVAYLMELKSNLGPYLVIVPLSTLSNWSNEFQKWCPSAHVICYKGTPGQRKEIYKEQVQNGHFNVLLTTYEYIIKDKSSLRKITWQYAIVDEGHRMKNAASKFAKTLSSQYTTKYRLLLTGTPLMNELGELWSLLNFLLPAIFNSVDTFDQWFNKPFAQFGSMNEEEKEANFVTNEERMFIIHRLHELLRPFMLRRVKSEVLDQLPEKVEKILRCDLSSWQRELYQQISRKAAAENDSFVQPQPASRGLNNVVMQLRKVCNHPYLFCAEGYQINQNLIRSSAKFELLDRMLPKLKAAGHRVLMFTQMTAVMTILEDYFLYRGYLSLRLDGSTPAEEREKRMYKFNAPDSPYFIFLLSTRAGGLGLNLTSANTVIIFDSDWNPMMDLQAQDRAHRIGQRSDVSVFRLVTNSPVEEKILSRATEKLNMSELVVEAGQFDKRSVENDNSLERKKLMEVLLTDFSSNAAAASKAVLEDNLASEIAGSDNEDEDDDDEGSENSKEDELNELLSNNENDYQLYKSIDKERADDFGAVDTSLFTSDDDVPEWIKNPPRRKGKAAQNAIMPGDGPRKRKEVIYDDGLTEKQFLRLMDKQFDAEAAAKKQSAKGPRRGGGAFKGAAATTAAAATPVAAAATPAPGSELTDWTFRKLISCSKSVVALKDPSTKRRLSEIFLEKPSPEQYPDYYEAIEKPIAINDILRKCRAKLYVNLQEFRDDWKLIFANARQFNGEDSWVVKDGNALEKELDRVLKKNGFSEETPSKQKPAASKQKKSPPKQTSPKQGPTKQASPKQPATKAKKQALPKEEEPPKKKLRIKLSLKTLKKKAPDGNPEQAEAVEPVAEPSAAPEPDVPSTGRGRGRRTKKRKKFS